MIMKNLFIASSVVLISALTTFSIKAQEYDMQSNDVLMSESEVIDANAKSADNSSKKEISVNTKRQLTLEEAINLAITKSETVNVLNLDIQKMESLIDEANAARWPNITGNLAAQYQKMKSSFPFAYSMNMYGVNVGLNINAPIYTFGAISNAVDAAKKSQSISVLSKDLGIRELKYAVANAYYAALLADENYIIAKNSYESALKTKEIIENSASVRPVKSDLIRVSADLASRKPTLDAAKLQRETAYRLLKLLCVIDPTEEIELVGTFESNFGVIDKDDLLITISDYPELKALKEQSDLYISQSKAQRAAFYPKLVATGSYSYTGMDKEGFSLGNPQINASAGVALQFSLWDGGSAFAQARQSKLESMKVDEQYKEKLRSLTNDIVDKVNQYNTYKSILPKLKEAVLLAQKSYEMSSSRFRTGQVNALEINDTINGVTSAQQQYYQTLYQINVLIKELEKLTGKTLM